MISQDSFLHIVSSGGDNFIPEEPGDDDEYPASGWLLGDEAALPAQPLFLSGPTATVLDQRVSKAEGQIATGMSHFGDYCEQVRELERRVSKLEGVLGMLFPRASGYGVDADGNGMRPESSSGRRKRRSSREKAAPERASSTGNGVDDPGPRKDIDDVGETSVSAERTAPKAPEATRQSQSRRSVQASRPRKTPSSQSTGDLEMWGVAPVQIGVSPARSASDKQLGQAQLGSGSSSGSIGLKRGESGPVVQRRGDSGKDPPPHTISMYDFLVDCIKDTDSRSHRAAVCCCLAMFLTWHGALAFALFDASLLQLYVRKRIWMDKFPAGGFYNVVLPEWLVGDIGPSQPVASMMCGVGCVLVLAAAMARDTRKAFYEFRPPRPISDFLEFYVSLTWLLRASVLPCYVSVGGTAAIIASDSPVEMVAHTITALFLLCLDDLAYRCLLDSEHRDGYEKRHRRATLHHHSSLQQQGILHVLFQAQLSTWVVRALIAEEACSLGMYFLHARLFPTADTSKLLWSGLFVARITGLEICRMLTTQFQGHSSSCFYFGESRCLRLFTVGAHLVSAIFLAWLVFQIFGFRESDNDCALRCLSDMQDRSKSCAALFPGWPNPQTSYTC